MKKESTALVSKKNLLPFILVTSLFALWGFANDITNPMVSAFKKVMELDKPQASWVQAAFYGGYFTMALPAAYTLKKYSYKAGILIGLSLYALGALLFYPAATMQSYAFFLVALYVLTFGLAFLETTANPLILSLGAKETATQRLNLAQAFNPHGAISGLMVAQMFILQSLQSDDLDENGRSIYETLGAAGKEAIRSADLIAIRNPYVVLGLTVLGILLLISRVHIPEKKEEQGQQNRSMVDTIKTLFKMEQCYGGFMAQLFYVGAQIMCWTYIYQYAENIGIENADAINYAYIALGLFLVGRFIFTFLMKYVDSGKLLMLLSIGAILFTSGTIAIQGIYGLYSLIMVSFCMSLMFPTIYGITLKNLGEDAKTASTFLVMAIVGGALMPVLQGMILDIGGPGYNDIRLLGLPEINISFAIPLLCFIAVAVYGYRIYKTYTFKP